MGRPALSVVVMGYRNQATIVDAVSSVMGQVMGPVTGQAGDGTIEVVVVTSGGDASADLVASAYRGSELSVVDSPHRLMPGAARNRGVAASSGDVVAFLAADCLAEPGWAAARLAAHRDGHRVVAGAMTSAPPMRPAPLGSHLALFSSRLPGRPAGPVAWPDPAAHGLSFDRGVLAELGPFDPECRIGEDTKAARRLAQLGVEIWFAPGVRTAHRGPASARAMVTNHYRRGAMAARAEGAALRPTTRARAMVGFWPVAGRAVFSTVWQAWHNGRGQRAAVVLALPWLVLARAAGVAGRYRERLDLTHPGAGHHSPTPPQGIQVELRMRRASSNQQPIQAEDAPITTSGNDA